MAQRGRHEKPHLEEGQRLAHVLGLLGLSQSAFAREYGCLSQHIAHICAGRNVMSRPMMRLLHERWGVRYEYLIDGALPALEANAAGDAAIDARLKELWDEIDERVRAVKELKGEAEGRAT